MTSALKELKSLPSDIYEQGLCELIEEYFGRSRDEFDISYNVGSSKGDGYASELYRVQISDKWTSEILLNLIAKLPPQLAIRREMFSTEIYTREIEFYKNLYPLYKNFQEERGINLEKDGFHQVPVCYKTTNDGLFLEDLKTKGFELFDKQKPVSAEQVFLVMKTIAKMHALFFAMRDQKPVSVEKFSYLSDIFTIMAESDNNPMDPWFESSKEQTMKVVAESRNQELIGKMKEICKIKFSDHVKAIFEKEKHGNYATICHGDCWNNNMLFTFDETNTPKDIRFIDFQVLRFASPVCDLVYYIFGATDKSLRDKYYSKFMDVYYDELSNFVTRLGSNPEKLYPRHIFDEQLKTFGRFGLIMAIIALPIMTGKKEDVPDFDKLAQDMKEKNEAGEIRANAFEFAKANSDLYTERMLGVCQDMLSLGYI